MQQPLIRRSLLAVAIAGTLAPGLASAQIEEVIVTAQKRAESVQDVPIAITAFSQEDMAAKQIVNFADMRYSAPSVTFTKGNFTGTNFKVRGIGTDLVAASSDNGVGVHINEVPLNSPRLFETEFFDVEQLLVLRGPQGTLYGRNSTGGAINMITRPAQTGEFDGNLEAQVGNYQHRKVNGMVNIPLGDDFAVRLAGLWLNRDGYTKNTYLNTRIDDRDQYSLRASFRWTPTDATTIDLMASWFDENDTRTRSQKQLCHQDPTAILGCLPDYLTNETPHPSSQLSNILASTAVLPTLPGLGPLGIHPFMSTIPNTNPKDMREVYADRDPKYDVEETLVTLAIKHEFERHTLDVVAGYQDTPLSSQMDYLQNVGQSFTLNPALAVFMPTTFGAMFQNGTIPMSAPSDTATGVVGGHIDSRLNRLEAYDQSNQDTDQRSIEIRVSSQYDGRVNWVGGLFWMDVDMDNEYWVFSNGLDYFSLVYPRLLGAQGQLGPGVSGDGIGWVAPNFNNRTDFYGIESKAAFGEVYFDITDRLKLTLGARYTVDKKEIQDRQYLFNRNALGIPLLQPIGADLEVGVTARDTSDKWEEWTGRVVLDWTVNDQTMAYASYSRGYKGGGFNPPFNPAEFPSQKPDFEPEFIDSFEIGVKNSLFDNTLQANIGAYYYDYGGMQVSKIVNRTSFNENTDAELYGVEAEFVFAPDDHWLISGNASYEHTEIKDLTTVDPRDPSGGRSDVTVLKDLSNGSNCVAQVSPAQFAGFGLSPFTNCTTLRNHPVLGPILNITDGISVDLDGNELALTPEWKINLGVQYTFELGGGMSLATRVDYYWQADMWGRNFNRDPIDKIDSWDLWNAQATLTAPDERWYLRAYVKNILNDDNITGMYITDPSSGLFTNVFTLEPRTYGVSVGYNF